ncbi:MAG: 2TM domain-containing protein [Bacteroidota bacterium]
MSRRSPGRKRYEDLPTADKKREFIRHFRTYLVMSIFFVVLNVIGGSGHFWAIYPILGWGIGVLMQYLSLYGPLADEETEEEFDLDYRRPEKMDLKELDPQRGYRDEDLV